MSLMNQELYDALIEGGTSETKARRAAQAVADYEGKLSSIDTKLAIIGGDITLMKWMLGTVIAIGLGILFKLF